MTLPDYQTLMSPFLHELGDGQAHPVRKIADKLAARLALSEEDARTPQ